MLAPQGRSSHGDAGRPDGRELHVDHPVGEGQVELDGRRVVVQCLLQMAHLVVTLSHHRFIADRVDPARLHGLDGRTAFGLESLQSADIIAVVEVGERRMIARRRGLPRAELGCRMVRAGTAQAESASIARPMRIR